MFKFESVSFFLPIEDRVYLERRREGKVYVVFCHVIGVYKCIYIKKKILEIKIAFFNRELILM